MLRAPQVSVKTGFLSFYDVATKVHYAPVVDSKDTDDTFTAVNHIKGYDEIAQIYSDNWEPLCKVTLRIGARWESSQPGIPQTNGLIEQCNKVLRGIRASLVQAGLPDCFWVFAGRYWCLVLNTTHDD